MTVPDRPSAEDLRAWDSVLERMDLPAGDYSAADRDFDATLRDPIDPSWVSGTVEKLRESTATVELSTVRRRIALRAAAAVLVLGTLLAAAAVSRTLFFKPYQLTRDVLTFEQCVRFVRDPHADVGVRETALRHLSSRLQAGAQGIQAIALSDAPTQLREAARKHLGDLQRLYDATALDPVRAFPAQFDYSSIEQLALPEQLLDKRLSNLDYVASLTKVTLIVVRTALVDTNKLRVAQERAMRGARKFLRVP